MRHTTDISGITDLSVRNASSGFSSFVAKSKIKQSIPLSGHTKYEGKTRRKLAWLSVFWKKAENN